MTYTSRPLVGTAAFAALALVFTLLAGAAPKDATDVSVPPIVPPGWLAERLGSTGVVILDARPIKDFVAAHIPGAQSLLSDNVRSSSAGVPGELFPPEVLSVVLGRLGITPASVVVAYGQGPEPDAAFLATVLRLAGVRRAAVLDGGFARWSEEKRATSTERPAIAATTFAATIDPSMLAKIDDVRRISATGSAVLLDVRPKEMYDQGHIPGALSRPFTNDFVPAGQPLAGSFRPSAELAEEYRALGVVAGKPVVVYCNSGHMASSTFYLLRHVLGYADVRLYDGSWLEWTSRQGASQPAATGDRLERARSAAAALTGDLLKRLTAELGAGGPAWAVKVCSEVAPELARAHSRDGATVRRVSLRTRNAANAPDAWERERLLRMQADAASGTKPEEVVETTDGTLRLLRPIVIAAPCLSCHGDPAAIDPEVRRLLAERYPQDQATGYRAGDLRGAVSVRIAAP